MVDYEIIKPKVDLRKKIKILPNNSDFDPVAKAEQALQRLSVNFGTWMQEEVERLQAAWQDIEDNGYSEDRLTALFRSGHDLKGQAHTMGFPIAGNIAGSMCDLIEKIEDRDQLPMDMLRKHVQAIKAVVKEDARAEDNAIGKALAQELAGIAEDWIAKIAPDKLEDGSHFSDKTTKSKKAASD
ncbi:Hpt domain-containing protein [Cohaesibacter sp. CAU 1516]|uniref:Hpt domain-containing protein n=1 Tax=Cohaesibacter sp. CAU 1516 TaxID=2576038 RepID=UPI001485C1E2|nr:Hpt domain-containing protein [Cohaesibacter sp. CAU 1516]